MRKRTVCTDSKCISYKEREVGGVDGRRAVPFSRDTRVAFWTYTQIRYTLVRTFVFSSHIVSHERTLFLCIVRVMRGEHERPLCSEDISSDEQTFLKSHDTPHHGITDSKQPLEEIQRNGRGEGDLILSGARGDSRTPWPQRRWKNDHYSHASRPYLP